MLRVPVKVYGEVRTFKKTNVVEKLFFFFKIEIFCKNHLPTRHLKYKLILLLIKISVMANTLLSTILKGYLGQIKSRLTL